MSEHRIKEEALLEKICEKHNIDPTYLQQLIMIEKDFANRNMVKRSGIFNQISSKILEWVESKEELEWDTL